MKEAVSLNCSPGWPFPLHAPHTLPCPICVGSNQTPCGPRLGKAQPHCSLIFAEKRSCASVLAPFLHSERCPIFFLHLDKGKTAGQLGALQSPPAFGFSALLVIRSNHIKNKNKNKNKQAKKQTNLRQSLVHEYNILLYHIALPSTPLHNPTPYFMSQPPLHLINAAPMQVHPLEHGEPIMGHMVEKNLTLSPSAASICHWLVS